MFLVNPNNLPVALAAIFSRGKTRIFKQVHAPRGLEQAFPCFLVTGQMDYEWLGIGADKAVNTAPRKIVAGNRFTAVQIVGHMGLDKSQAHLQQRDVDELATPGFLRGPTEPP